MTLQETIRRIRPPDEKAASACRARWNRIAKPLYGLGALEEMLVRISAMQGTAEPDIRKKALVIFCADNGVVAEGVSQTGQETTAVVAENFIDGKSCAAIMCKRAGADLYPVDVGMAVDTPRVEKRKTRCGTANMARGPAMTREEALFAIEAGICKARELADAGYGLLAAGEMGIGNTTTSSAVTAVLLYVDPEAVTGAGAGLSPEGVIRKAAVIRRAIEVNRPDPEDPIDVLAKVGGYDIAAMCGLFIGGAASRVPVVIDGFISAVAALLAVKTAPASRGYMLPSHISGEPAAGAVMEALGFAPSAGAAMEALGFAPSAGAAANTPGFESARRAREQQTAGGDITPILHAGMHLGEGTGAAALFPLLDMACDIYEQMDTFEEIHVEQYKDYENQ